MTRSKTAPDPRQHILNAAAEIFAREGYAGARIDDIARRAAVNKAMLYYHVGDKDALYAAVFDATIAEARSRLETAAASAAGPVLRFRAVVRAMAHMAFDRPHFAPLVLRAAASGGADLPDSILSRLRAAFQVIATVLAEGEASGAFRSIDPYMTHMFIGGSVLVLISGAPLRSRVRGTVAAADRNPDEIADYVSGVLLEGLCERPSAPHRKRAGSGGRTSKRGRS